MVRLKNITRSTLVFASGRVLKPEEELQLKTISAELTEGLMRGWVAEVPPVANKPTGATSHYESASGARRTGSPAEKRASGAAGKK